MTHALAINKQSGAFTGARARRRKPGAYLRGVKQGEAWGCIQEDTRGVPRGVKQGEAWGAYRWKPGVYLGV